MEKYVQYNPNPKKQRNGDCVIRALTKALNKDWHKIYVGVCLQGFIMCDMPSANHVWGAFLRRHGFKREIVEENNPESYPYTLEQFCNDHDYGVFVVAMPDHVVAVVDGWYYDSWNSGHEKPLYYWVKEE